MLAKEGQLEHHDARRHQQLAGRVEADVVQLQSQVVDGGRGADDDGEDRSACIERQRAQLERTAQAQRFEARDVEHVVRQRERRGEAKVDPREDGLVNQHDAYGSGEVKAQIDGVL